MTYRERLEQDRPNHTGERFRGGCCGCPGHYYKDAPEAKKNPCEYCRGMKCTACWDQEIAIKDKTKPIVYIAGAITGVVEYWTAFERAEDELFGLGCIPLSPAHLPEGMMPEHYARICTAMIDSADVVFALPGWEESRGASLEVRLCQYTGKPVVHTYEDLREVLRV